MKQHICQYKAEELLIIPKDKLIENMEEKMEAAEWEKIEGESLTEYLAEIKPTTMDKEFNIYQVTDWSKEVKENISQEEIEEIFNEFQNIVFKRDHDIGNCNLIEHAIRLTDDIPTTCRLR